MHAAHTPARTSALKRPLIALIGALITPISAPLYALSPPPPPRYTLSGSIGSGLGYLPGGSPTAHPSDSAQARVVSPGIAPTYLHFHSELAWFPNPYHGIALHLRWQPLPAQDFSAVPASQKTGRWPATRAECLGLPWRGDCIVAMRYKHVLTHPDLPTRVYGLTGLGVGRSRHALTLREGVFMSDGTPNPECFNRDRFERQQSDGTSLPYCELRDTVRTGWLHWTLGLGLSRQLQNAPHLAITAEALLTLATPDNASVDLDLSLGIQRRF